MTLKVRVLIVEDNEDDEELILRELARGGLLVEHDRVATQAGFEHALARKEWDVILCDYVMPGFGAPQALRMARAKGETPFIIVSGAIGEETAVEIMRAGADDYVSKGNLGRLVPVVKRELQDAKTLAYQKKQEAEIRRLHAAIEQTLESVMITDVDANLVYVNEAFEKVTGYTRAEAIGRNPRLLKSGKQDIEFYRKMWEKLLSGQSWHGHIINKRKDGTLFEESATITPVVDGAGKITNYVAIKRDVTSDAMLGRAKDYFTSVTSHEMFTPLSKLMLARTMLGDFAPQDVETREKIKEVLEDAYSSFERISNATSLLSNIALAQEGALRPLLIRPMIANAAAVSLEQLQKAGRKIEMTALLDALPLETAVVCDQKMMTQMFSELLSNAVKYTPDGKSISVSARCEAGNLIVEIADQGMGIPEEQLEAVFEPFFSLENPLHHMTSKYAFMAGGIGLGLTVAKMIVNFHGGSIQISSGNPGTIVTVVLPISPSEKK